MLRLRNLGRALGVNRLLEASLGRRDYEDRFQAAMLGAIRPGDIVWDVGTNIRLYSKKFSAITGLTGKVFAYEPSPTNLQRLNTAVASLVNVNVLPFALGEHEGVVVLEQGDDPLGATNRIVAKADRRSESEVEIQLSSGDGLVSSGAVASSNVIKIDTEGFELALLLV